MEWREGCDDRRKAGGSATEPAGDEIGQEHHGRDPEGDRDETAQGLRVGPVLGEPVDEAPERRVDLIELQRPPRFGQRAGGLKSTEDLVEPK